MHLTFYAATAAAAIMLFDFDKPDAVLSLL